MSSTPLATMTIVSAALLTVLVAIAVYTDVRWGKIHNALTAPFAVLGLVLNSVDRGLAGLTLSLLGIAVGLGVFLLSAGFGRILGGGDIKLLMAIGALQGAPFVLWTIVYMALAGGVLAVGIALWRKDLMASLRRLGAGLSLRAFARVPIDVADAKSTARLPYAIPIAIGSLAALYLLRLHGAA